MLTFGKCNAQSPRGSYLCDLPQLRLSSTNGADRAVVLNHVRTTGGLQHQGGYRLQVCGASSLSAFIALTMEQYGICTQRMLCKCYYSLPGLSQLLCLWVRATHSHLRRETYGLAHARVYPNLLAAGQALMSLQTLDSSAFALDCYFRLILIQIAQASDRFLFGMLLGHTSSSCILFTLSTGAYLSEIAQQVSQKLGWPEL